MPLSDIAIRAAKPGPKPIKLSDERGLFLLVQPSGGKLWRLKYRIAGKEKKLSLGRYPDVALKEARERCTEARKLIASGIDPSEQKRTERLDATLRAENTFKAVAEEYIEKSDREGRAAVTIGKARWLLSLLEPALGSRPVDEISPVELLGALKKVEAKGHLETARRMRSFASRVFRYAVATARAKADPAATLRGALVAPKVTHHAAILDAKGVGALLRAIDGYDGQPMTQLALKLAPHVFVRPGELRQAEWEEIDLEAGVWKIAASKMKMRQPHMVPLSRQAIAILQAAQALTGRHRYVFASLYPGKRPMSENTINAALRRLGYSGDEMTAHGFRAMASTLLNESGKWNPDAIERALAHKAADGLRGAYHRGAHWAERVEMAQWWSDYLDTLRAA
ncbi:MULTISPECIES: integrase arm-type DNA-binding domain-containing protein [unclassified Sphingopyxis]|uniref:tyrosine-type recombinase/integrase n=1 Tax=unclassified Sphingopyxis TaxID=2614943 RepID=UPI000731CBE3|nr:MULTISPECIES: integrase arm-type DNA-binding domain-containing protein [unclassified Sphingopyxis]KTE23894.1 integrase [Sphingopyxis sp. H057]KTE51047.1 integrase [Sphingopyxis sp. H073]KTE51258.1 integrase [Sphingopyxis sp. H071]KTE58835.1 integrase [Sphingopyxis sp. H107]KTE61226.1 integrase [Sphingopyxis sp. H100]